MKLTLNTYQRGMLMAILGGFTGRAGEFRKAVKLLDILEFSPEEKETIEFKEIQPGQYTWSPDHTEDEWTLEVADREMVAFLKRQVKGFEGWGMSRRVDVVDLLDKLEIEVESDDE